MRYTRYFSEIIKQHGTVNLDQAAMQAFLNIIHLEAELKVYERWNQENRFVLEISNLKEQVKMITGGVEPKIFMKKLYHGEFLKPPSKGSIAETKPWDEFDVYMKNIKKRH